VKKCDITEFGFYLGNKEVYIWAPTPTITIYELATILPSFTSFSHIQDNNIRDKLFKRWFDSLPSDCKRHFRIEKYE
jgi:hypothetical protein